MAFICNYKFRSFSQKCEIYEIKLHKKFSAITVYCNRDHDGEWIQLFFLACIIASPSSIKHAVMADFVLCKLIVVCRRWTFYASSTWGCTTTLWLRMGRLMSTLSVETRWVLITRKQLYKVMYMNILQAEAEKLSGLTPSIQSEAQPRDVYVRCVNSFDEAIGFRTSVFNILRGLPCRLKSLRLKFTKESSIIVDWYLTKRSAVVRAQTFPGFFTAWWV